MTTSKSKIKRRLQGTVVSDKMEKTVVVKVDRVKIHPKYHKRYRTSRKYHAHDARDEFKVGDQVEIEAIRPLSKNKKWLVIKKVK